MKTALLTAVVAIGLGITPAFAANNSGYAYPNFWGTQPAAQQVPTANAPAQWNGATIDTYATQSSQGTWLFPPTPNSG